MSGGSATTGRKEPGRWCRWFPRAGFWWVPVALLYALPFVTGPAGSAIYVKFDSIEGESAAPGFEGWIEVQAEADAIRRLATGGAQRRSSPATFDEVTIKKLTDVASVQFFASALANTRHGTAEIHFTRATKAGAPQQTYLKIELEDVLVTSVAHSVGADAPGPETVTLSAGRISKTVPQGGGTGPDSTISAVWDVAAKSGSASYSGPGSTLPPTVAGLADQTVAEDGSATQAFTVLDDATPAGFLEISCETSDPGLVPYAGIVLGGGGTNRTVTVTPAPDAHGSATVTLIVSDGQNFAVGAFAVEVTPENDPPTLDPIAPQVSDGGAPVVVSLTVGDIDSDPGALVVTAAADDPAILPPDGVVTGGAGTARTLTLTPAPGAAGTSTVTVEVSDGELASGPVSFLFLANGPVAGEITDVELAGGPVPENSPPGTPVGTLSATGPDPTTVGFVLLDDAGGRFELAGSDLSVFNSSLLDYEAGRSHSVLVVASDSTGGSLGKVIEIELSNVNEAPVLTVPAAFEAEPGIPLALDGIGVSDPDATGDDTVAVDLAVAGGTLDVEAGLVPGAAITGNGSNHVQLTVPLGELQQLLASSGGVTFTAPADAEGSDTFDISVNDNGNRGSGGPAENYASIPVNLVADPYEFWRTDNFSALELADPSLSGPGGNLDDDVFTTLAEYAVGGDVRTPDSEEAFGMLLEVTDGGTTYPAVRFRRRTAAADPDLTVLVFVWDGTDWRGGDSAVTTVSTEPIDATFEWVTVRSNAPTSGAVRQLFQVRVFR